MGNNEFYVCRKYAGCLMKNLLEFTRFLIRQDLAGELKLVPNRVCAGFLVRISD